VTREEFDALIVRWLSGEATPEDQEAMADELRRSEESRLRFAELADQDAALRILSQGQSQAEQIRSQYRTTRRRTAPGDGSSWSRRRSRPRS
jgi:hypothetical protein